MSYQLTETTIARCSADGPRSAVFIRINVFRRVAEWSNPFAGCSIANRPGLFIKTVRLVSNHCLCWTILCLLMAGCSDDRPHMVEVTGKVVFKGQPLTAGSIHFHPDHSNSFQDDTPSSLLQVDGSFLIKTFPYGEGVPPGKYQVTLSPQLATRIRRPDYGDLKQTPWTLVVTDSGIKDHVFEVK